MAKHNVEFDYFHGYESEQFAFYRILDMKKKKGIEQMDVAEKIRYFRQQKGLSQEQFGKRAGIHEQSIRKYELGIRKPKIDQLKKIAGGLESV